MISAATRQLHEEVEIDQAVDPVTVLSSAFEPLCRMGCSLTLSTTVRMSNLGTLQLRSPIDHIASDGDSHGNKTRCAPALSATGSAMRTGVDSV